LGAINGPDKSGKVRTDEVSPPCPRAAQRMTAGSAADWHSAYGSAGLSQNRFATDSPLEGGGFEPSVPATVSFVKPQNHLLFAGTGADVASRATALTRRGIKPNRGRI
jgi:hypothetical protein